MAESVNDAAEDRALTAGHGAPTQAPAVASPRRPATAVATSPHATKFRIAIAVLIAIGLASLAFALLIVGREPATQASARWSAWAPADEGALGASEIAGRIAPFYRATASNQLDVVTLVHLANPNVATSTTGPGSGLELAVQTGSSTSSLGLLSGTTVAYNICGIGTSNCALSGTPTSARLLLLRREALELALYTLRYISGTNNVVALLPPARTQPTSTLSPTRPTTKSTPRRIGLAVLFDRQELAPLLSRPLSATLAPYPPLATQLPRWIKTSDAGVVDQVTARGLFAQRIEQLQDGSRLLVLTSIPPQ